MEKNDLNFVIDFLNENIKGLDTVKPVDWEAFYIHLNFNLAVLNLPYKEIANDLGVDVKTLYRWRKGKTKPSVKNRVEAMFLIKLRQRELIDILRVS